MRSLYEQLIRPLLFLLPPEAAHEVACGAASWLPRADCEGDAFEWRGLRFPNRIGLAAGMDKDARFLAHLQRLGFGFLEAGTVVPEPQPGNPKPRVFRLREDEGVVNWKGLDSRGVARFAERLRAARPRLRVPVGASLGKNAATPERDAIADYERCLHRLLGLADYFVANLSCPNVPGDAAVQDASTCRALVERLRRACDKPLLVKLSPDLAPPDQLAVAEAALAAGADGLVAVNTTAARPAGLRSRRAAERGGLSGRPLFPLALRSVETLRRRFPDDCLLIGCGGVGSVADAQAMLDAGADLVQIFTALVYRGPTLVRALAQGLRGGAPAD